MVRTIKFLQMLLILGSISLGEVSQAGSLPYPHYCGPSDMSRAGGDDHGGSHPWPWGFEVRFPWENVQGFWRAEKNGKVFYFIFQRVQLKRIKIKQIDIDTCYVIGVGQGLEREKTIVAQIRNALTDETFNLTLYAFNEEDSPEPPVLSGVGPSQVIVARINSLDYGTPEFAAQMVRISDRLDFDCSTIEKKVKY